MNSKLPNQITVTNGSGRSGSAIEKVVEKHRWHVAVPYLARQLSVFGPGRALDQRVILCYVLPNSDGEAKRIHRVYPSPGKEGPTSSRGRECCIYLHRSACVEVTSCEREKQSQVSKENENVEVLLMIVMPPFGGSPLPPLL
jgi:hypothetical protein